MQAILSRIVEELRQKYGCHTVVLYGSRARDEHSDTSDFDIFALRASGPEVHDAREFEGEYLDAFIVPESTLAADPDPALIRLRHGRVLVEKDGMGQKLLEKSQALFRAGPKPLSPEETRLLVSWTRKTIARVSRGGPDDVESNFRRVWLLHDLLEMYFKLRGRWYRGPKESFDWLRENDAAAFHAFEVALAPDASRGSLRVLAELVLGAAPR